MIKTQVKVKGAVDVVAARIGGGHIARGLAHKYMVKAHSTSL
jgi:hypothetical protein